MRKVLVDLRERITTRLPSLVTLVEQNADYATYSSGQKAEHAA